MNEEITMDPELKHVYETVKKNSYNINEISNDVESIYSNINNSNFEGMTKDLLISTLSQIAKDISTITEHTNVIIKKENILNNEFEKKLEKTKNLIDETNELIRKRKLLQNTKNQIIAKQKKEKEREENYE